MGAIIPAIVLAFSVGSVVILGIFISFTAQQWALYLITAGAFVLFIVTPTRIGVRYIQSLQSTLVIMDQPYEEMTEHGGRGWGLTVHNQGSQTAYECKATLEDIDFEVPVTGLTMAMYPKREMYWTNQHERPYYEIGPNQTAHLEVSYYEYPTKDANHRSVTLAYRAREELRAKASLPADQTVIVLLSISSKQQKTQFIVLRLDTRYITNLILRGLSNGEPVSILWQGYGRRGLADFQKALGQTTPLGSDPPNAQS